MEIWEQQIGEVTEAFQAFRLYRDMGPCRKLRDVAEAQMLDSGKIIAWCRQWDWLKRCRAYDAYLGEVSLAEYQAEAKSMLQRHVELALKMLDRASCSIADADLSSTQNLVRWIKEAAHIERQSREELFKLIDTSEAGDNETDNTQPFTLLDLTDEELNALTKIADRLDKLKEETSEGESPPGYCK